MKDTGRGEGLPDEGVEAGEEVLEAGAVEPAAVEPEPGLWGRLRARWWVRWLMDGALMIAIVWGVLAWQGRNLLDTRTPAPEFALQAMTGERVALSDLKGKPVVVLFWAPWCSVCKLESSNISGLKEAVGDEVEVISVVLGYEDRAQVQAYMDEHEVDYPVLLGNRNVSNAYKVDKFPTVYFIDEEGGVKGATVGYSTEVGLRARVW